MANILIEQTTMVAIADAIRTKLGETTLYLPSEMPAKILSITGSGGGGGTLSDGPVYVHSSNVSDDGTINGTTSNTNTAQAFTITGAKRLRVELHYSVGSASSGGYICVWKGAHSDYTPSANNSSAIVPPGASNGKIAGGSSKHTFSKAMTLYVDGDSVTVGYYTFYGNTAGYYAIITAVDDSYTPAAWSGWGDEAKNGFEKWWTDLKKWIDTSTYEDRLACVGKKKGIPLNGVMICGAGVLRMVCIGADVDGYKTLTFDSELLLPDTLQFMSSSVDAQWETSQARSVCQTIYDYLIGKTAIKKVKKNTCTSYNGGSGTILEESVFLVSEVEVFGGRQQAASEDEGDQYQYYQTASNRKKYIMDPNTATATTAGSYWLRSRAYGSSNSLRECTIDTSGSYTYYGTPGTSKRYLSPAFVIG